MLSLHFGFSYISINMYPYIQIYNIFQSVREKLINFPTTDGNYNFHFYYIISRVMVGDCGGGDRSDDGIPIGFDYDIIRVVGRPQQK